MPTEDHRLTMMMRTKIRKEGAMELVKKEVAEDPNYREK